MNESYCSAPFSEIYVDSNNKYRLCCHARKGIVSASEQLPFDFFQSEYMDKVRRNMLEGKKVSDCERCYQLENAGKYSFRQRYVERSGYTEELNKINLKLRINGSYCNLACYMCHPTNSSERRRELREIYGDDWKDKIIPFGSGSVVQKLAIDNETMKRATWEDTIENINNNIHLVDTIDMTGGEPLQLVRHWEWIKSIPEEYAKNITLRYDSNLTKLEFKGNSIFYLKEKFKKVQFNVSCDHYGEKLHYIRYPINVEEFEKNLRTVIDHSFDVYIQVAVSILNIDDLHEIEDYYRRNFDIDVHFNVVGHPFCMSIRNISDEQKEFYRYKYKDFSIVLSELQKDPDKDWHYILSDYLDKLYTHRGLKWREVFEIDSFL